jgi:hypothetical protein
MVLAHFQLAMPQIKISQTKLEAASKAAMPAVVHIKTLLKSAIDNSNFRQPYGNQSKVIFLQ